MASDTAARDAPASAPVVGRLREAPRHSLRWLVLLCVALPVLVYGAVGLSRYQQIRSETEVRLDRALRIATEHALKIFDANEAVLARMLDVIGDEPPDALSARQEALHLQLRAMSRDKPQIQSIWVIGPDGRPLVGGSVYPVPTDVSVTDRSYFEWHRNKGGGLYVSEPMMGRITQTPFFDMSRGRYGPDGHFAGVVSISLRPAYFESFHADLAADEPGLAITMFRDDGTIVSRWPALTNAPAKLAPGSPVMSRVRAGERGGSAHGVSSVDGRERLLTFAKVGGYPVYLGTGMAVHEITRRWLAEMGWLAAFGLPPLLAFFLVARVALRRTHEALQAAQRLQDETAARRRAEEVLLQSQKLEALGRLTGGVAHDFNNALMVISNNIFLLKRQHPEADGPQLASMARAVGSATKVTRQLLAFSRRQALVPEHLRLQDRLAGLRDLLEPLLGSQVTLAVQVSPDTRPILVDPAELELALINLAINARDAMPGGGRFVINAHNVVADLPSMAQGPLVVVEATDTGKGIAAEHLDKVFEPFFTTKPLGEGTGLGLSQVYGLCQRAGGRVAIESRPGAGTTVRLFFPATTEVPAQATAAVPSTPLALRHDVLLVEDDDEVAAALKPVLEALGCKVTRLDRGTAARDWLADRSELPDLVLTDVVMPGGMDGLALARHVRERYPGVGVVLISGYAEQLEAIGAQGFEILPKPCSPELLVAAVERVLSTERLSRKRFAAPRFP